SPAPRQQVLQGKAGFVTQKSQQSEQEFARVEAKAGEAADQRAVEADVLQIAADIDLDQRDQLRHVPALHLVRDEALYAALLVGNEAAQHDDEALVDLAAQLGIASERI